MDNQQRSFHTYCSCDCEGRLYIGYHYGFSNDNYLGSFTDNTFQPKHKLILSEHSTKEIALLQEWAYHTAWNVYKHNPRFANKARCNFSGNVEAYGKGNPTSPSEETRKKISQTLKGNTPWNKGLSKKTDSRVAMKPEVSKKISESMKGKKSYERTPEIRNKISKSLKGKKQSNFTKLKRKISILNFSIKTGFSPNRKKQYSEEEIQELRKNVQRLERDLVGLEVYANSKRLTESKGSEDIV